MKKLLMVAGLFLLVALTNYCFAQQKDKAKSKNNGMANHASGITGHTIGKAAYAKMIIEMWKDWDDNAFDRHDYFADSVVIFLPDGMVVKGKQENLEGAKKFRGGLTSAKSTIYACVPLVSPDKKEEAVCIWGTEEDTFPDGKVERRDLHEVWWFNKAGKIYAMRQFAAKFGAP